MSVPTSFAKPINNIATTVANAYTAGSGSLQVTSAAGITLTAGQWVRVCTFRSGAPLSILKATAVTGNVLTIAGGVDGYTDVNLLVGDAAELRVTAGAFSDIHTALNAVETLVESSQSANLIFAGPATGAAAAPTFRVMVAADLPAGLPTGTVTSVAQTVPAEFSVSGSPITASGTLAITKATQAANLVWAGPTTGAAAQPTFRALVMADLPGGLATGTVTSVALSAPAEFSVAGSPVTTSGTLAITKANQTANLVWAGPTTGSPAAPTFRALVSADLPSSAVLAGAPTTTTPATNDNSTKVATTAYIQAQAYLTANQSITLSGDVSGSGTTAITTAIGASKVTNAMLAGSITAAKLVGTDIATVGTITAGTWTGTTVALAHGGTGQTDAFHAFNALSPMTTLGDLIYGGASGTGTRVGGNTSSTKNFLTQTGTGSISAAPAWGVIAAADYPTMVGDAGSGGTKGAVPAPGAGDTAAGRYLKADGSWAVPPGGAATTPGSPSTSVQFNDGGSFAGDSNMEFNKTTHVLTLGVLPILPNQSANVVYSGPGTGAAAAPGFRSLVAADLPTVPLAGGGTGQTTKAAAFDALQPMSAVGDLVYGGTAGTGTRLSGNTSTTKNFLTQTGTGAAANAPAWGTVAVADVAGAGTVTSVSLSAPGEFSVTGSPVTASGTLAIAKVNQNANLIYAGPTTGAAAAPGFRSLVAADLPTVPITGGGTGATTKAAGFDALSPLTTAGDLLYGGASGTGTRFAPNATATKNFLTMTSSTPAWGTIAVGDVSGAAPLASPTFTGTPSLPTGTTGITQTDGTNSTALATTQFVQRTAMMYDLSLLTLCGAL